MKDTTLSRLGRTCSIPLGISLIVVGITYLPWPPEQQQIVSLYTDPGAFLESFAKNSSLLTVEFWAEAQGVLLGIASVLAISATVRAVNEGWVRWTSTLAIIGLAITAIHDLRFLALTPSRAAAGSIPIHQKRRGSTNIGICVMSGHLARYGVKRGKQHSRSNVAFTEADVACDPF
jgi:hypothetical protein